MDREEFLQTIEKFLVKQKVSASEFGKEAVGNPCFVSKLRKGKYNPRIDTVTKVLNIISKFD